MVEDVFGIIGTTLAGTFHIEEVIAEGGFGVVYRAEHGAFRAPVALKCLKISGSVSRAKTDRLMESFREEAEILFHLSAHIPEVVRPLHADMMVLKDGTVVPYIAMEWVEGRPLDSIIIVREDEGLAPLTVGAVVKMLTPIAHALSKAHRFHVPGGAVVSVTHCDLKPENIVITDHGRPVRAKILDFGIARARDLFNQNVGKMTTSRVPRPFTPSYGAPEQWVPKRYGQTGPWTDVWGLALTMVECLTGKPPIDGDMHAMMGTALDPTRRPSPGADGVPISAAVEDVFQRGLAVDPRDRFQDIETFWSALEHAHGVASSFARARKRRARPTYDDDSLDSVRPPPPPAMQRSPRRPPRLTAAGPPLPTPSSAGRAAVRPNDGMEFRLEAEEPAIMRRATMQHGLPSLPQFPAAGLPSRQAFDPLAPESGREYSPVSEPEPSVQPAPANDDRAGTELDLGGLEDDVSEAFDRASSVAPG
ncbi:MAG TPA: serine/threonine protein kinase, partial [Sorangium sp.]|nr:serine/threonine protein kinase [Sorangium sp.]